ncbi:MAG TPA: hypothetical protein GX712_02540 [Bacteroidales bacterium]|nr:hypothetical protein [Bacteroidales bacterium]
MKKLHEIVKERFTKQNELSQKTEAFKKEQAKLNSEIQELLRLENVAHNGLDLDKIQIAEKLIWIRGNPFGKTSDVTKFGGIVIAECAIIDIAEDCKKMRTQFFGNKKYEGFYQRCDCEYGYGPRHGSIVDRIGLIDKEHQFTDDEKDACIYYIKNYNAVKEAKAKLQTAR